MMGKKTVITFQKLKAANANDAMDQLFEIFEDKYPILVAEDQTKWYFQLNWPIDKYWYVDPDLFSQKNDNILSCNDIPTYYKQYDDGRMHISVSMLHSKAILGISEILHFIKIDTIVHIDDHSDLMAPLLYRQGDGFYTSLFEGEIKITDINHMEKCIERGVFGIGSYLSAFILMTEPGFIYHIKQSSAFISSTTYSLYPRIKSQHIGGYSLKQTFLDKKDRHEGDALWKYKQTNNFEDVEETVGNVWLDIDLDYFSNRYDRDTDWKNKNTLNPNRAEMIALMQHTLLKITTSHWIKQVQFVSISYSPGFFPSEYFKEAQHFFIQPLIEYFKGR
ncbi:hypothetical protein [Paenibacillus campi]|uniref:hypothetical protein n=1 Tax=Paenibacillus campi TaxID=3106031 RepID=UPI002AFE3F68|nr:hypothetical protein [Paenibacillus sp. SGZ-1014]